MLKNVKQLIHSAITHFANEEAEDEYLAVVFHKDHIVEVYNELISCGFRCCHILYNDYCSDYYILMLDSEDTEFSIDPAIYDDEELSEMPIGGVWFIHEDAPSRIQTENDPSVIYVWGFSDGKENIRVRKDKTNHKHEDVKDIVDALFGSFLFEIFGI